MSTAARLAGWLSRIGGEQAASAGLGVGRSGGSPSSETVGIPILTGALSSARLVVEIAWGANLAGSPDEVGAPGAGRTSPVVSARPTVGR